MRCEDRKVVKLKLPYLHGKICFTSYILIQVRDQFPRQEGGPQHINKPNRRKVEIFPFTKAPEVQKTPHTKDTYQIREAFKRKNRKYIGLLPIRGTPPSPLQRGLVISGFFFGHFLEWGGHNWEKILLTFYMFLSIQIIFKL